MSRHFSISSFLSAICICILFSYIGICHCDIVVNQTSLLNPSKLRIHNGQLYIGARNNIYRLNSDLSKNFTIDTCPVGCSVNYNKVLLVRGENDAVGELFACGTGNGSRCAWWSLRNTSSPIESSGALLVSPDVSRPAEAVWNNEKSITLAATSISADYLLSIQDLSSFAPESIIPLQSGSGDFLVYFKASLHYETYAFFLTNQKAFKNDDRIVSKIIRLCTDKKDFFSYHDMILQCTSGESTYNLVQDAVFLQTDKGSVLLVAAFTKGESAADAVGSSLICSKELESLNESFIVAAAEFLNYTTTKQMVYLADKRVNPFNVSAYFNLHFWFTCAMHRVCF